MSLMEGLAGTMWPATHFPPVPSVHRQRVFWFASQAKLYPRVLAAMKPNATLGLSHGFLLGVMQNDGVDFREDINVILNAPKVGLSLSKKDRLS